MPVESTKHPDAKQLQAYGLGLLDDAQRARVDEHLAGCEACCSALTTVADDPFLCKVRAALSSREETPGIQATVGNASELAAGRVLGAYRLLEELGRGGMGVVYKAVAVRVPEHLVALKTLHPELIHIPEARQLFLREAGAMSRLKHERIAHINYVGEHDGVPFFTMPLLEGETLDSRLFREGRLPLTEVLRIGREIAAGLAAAHDEGLIHRDIKPANVWLESNSHPPGRVKLLDFGLTCDSGQAEIGRVGALLGTPAFMAPEQIAGQPIDARCDLFGLGCVLYLLCLGQSPFKRETVSASLKAIQEDRPTPVEQSRADLPPALGRLIDHLLAKDPVSRPTTARQVAEELAAIEQGLLAAPSPWRLRRIAAVAAIFFGMLGLAAWAAWSNLASWDGTRQVRQGSQPAHPGPAFPADSPFDLLGPAKIPPEERFKGMPEEVVAVLGQREKGKWDLVGQTVAVSPDGKSVLVPRAGAALLLDLTTGRELRAFGRRFVGPGVAFSADGRRVLCAGSEDLGSPSCTLWDAAAGKVIRQIGPERCVIFWVAFDPADKEGRRALVAMRDYHDGPSTIVLRDLATGGALQIYKGHTHYARGGAFAPDGRRFVSCGSHKDPAIRLWDVEKGLELRRFETKMSPTTVMSPHCVAFSPDGRHVLSGGAVAEAERDRPGAALLWDVEQTDSLPKVVLSHPGIFISAAFSPDGKTMAGVDEKAQVVVWECPSGSPLRKIQLEAPPTEASAALAFAPDGRHLVVAHGNGAVYVLRLAPNAAK